MAQASEALLRSVGLFASLSDAAMAHVVNSARTRTFAAGASIFQEGDPAESFFVLRQGSAKIGQVTPDGHQVVMRLLSAGDALGGVAVLGGSTYPVSAEAVTDVTLYEWPGSVMGELMQAHPVLAMNALRFVAARLHELQVQYRQLATEKVERRVARALLRLVTQAGRPVETGVLIDLPLSREDIGQMTGTTLFTVSRVFSRLEAAGIIEVGRQRVVICQPEALTAMAEDLT